MCVFVCVCVAVLDFTAPAGLLALQKYTPASVSMCECACVCILIYDSKSRWFGLHCCIAQPLSRLLVCACVCVRERERERESVCVRVYSPMTVRVAGLDLTAPAELLALQ